MNKLIGVGAVVLLLSALFSPMARAQEDPEANPAKFLNPKIFDWQIYAGFYPNDNFGTKIAAETHWLKYGLKAGRKGNANFHTVVYADKYAAVLGSLAVGSPELDYVALATEYLLEGSAAGRRAPPLKRAYSAILQSEPAYPNGGNAVVGNERIKIITSARFAGAIWQLWYKGTQIVDDTALTYGRLLQFAGWKNGEGPCYNFIEAGSQRWEDTPSIQPRSSLLTNKLAGGHEANQMNYLRTAATPALFRRLGDLDPQTNGNCTYLLPDPDGDRDELIRDDNSKLVKKINMNYGGDPNVVQVNLRYTNPLAVAPKNPNGPDKKKGFIFQLYAALTGFNKMYKVDMAACQVPSVNCAVAISPGNANTPGTSGYSAHHAIVLVREDKGIYFALRQKNISFPDSAADPLSLSYVGTFRYDSTGAFDIVDTSANLSLNYLAANSANAYYEADYFIVIGDSMEEVITKMKGLPN